MNEPTNEARIGGAGQKVRDAFADADPPLTNHLTWGAVLPGHLVFAFRTDADLERAHANGVAAAITERARAELRAAGCSSAVARGAGISLISEEEVDRQGGPMNYFR